MFAYICLLLIASIQSLYPATSKAKQIKTQTTIKQTKKPQAIPLTYAFDYEASTIFQAIDFPLDNISDSFTTTIFETIDENFGTKGLNLKPEQILLIKKTYLYLIFMTKLDAVQNNPKFKTYQSDFANYLKDNNTPTPHIPDEKLVTSTGWNAVTITSQDILNSPMWQLFCKGSVVDIYGFYYSALNIIHGVENQTFNYIPHIETSFYDHDYTNLRTINELTRIKVILETTCKDFFLSQCSDWNSLTSNNQTQSKKNKTATLEQQIVLFKQTPFYKNTHDINELLGIKPNDNQTISTSQLLSPKQLASPLKEQVWCYFMLNEMLTMFYGLIAPDRLTDVLTYCSQKNITPNVFPYTLDDYVYFEELLAVKSKTENTHTQSLHPSPQVHKKEDSHIPIILGYSLNKAKKDSEKNVKTQCFLDLCSVVSSIGHAISNAADDVKHAATDIGDSIENAAEAAGHSIAGVAEGAFGIGVNLLGTITDIKSIKEFGSEVQKKALSNLEESSKDMQTSIDDFSKGIVEANAALINIQGELGGIITDDKKLGEDFESINNTIASSLAQVGAKLLDAQIQYGSDAALMTTKASDQFASLVGSAVEALNTGDLHELGSSAEDLLNGTVTSITSSFSNLMSAGKDVLGSVMQGLGAIMNSLTTVFIDVVREGAFIVMSEVNVAESAFSGKFDFNTALQNAKEDRNLVTNKLEAHRQTINQVMGVAIAIGFTIVTEVASAGTATGADAAIDAELISGEIAETTTETVSEAASEAAETAKTAGETTEQITQAAGNAAKEAAEKAGETPAEIEEAETAAENAIEKSEQAAPKDEPEPSNEEQAKDEAKDDAKDEAKDDAKQKSKWDTIKKGLGFTLKSIGVIMNVVFGICSVLSGINGDALNEQKEDQQATQLINMWQYINDGKMAIVQNQGSYLQELQQKQQATLGNQILALAFLKNATYSNVNNMTEQISQALAKQLIPLLTPDTNDMISANIGSSWGIQSNYLDLYPTQGFSVTTTGRSDFPFAQEVAQAPYAANDLASAKDQQAKSDTPQKQSVKLWFNQKVTALDNQDDKGNAKKPTDPLMVAIDLQILYMINGPFYTGLYLGGNYHDYTSQTYLENLTKTNSFDLDSAHLAKMVVLFRDSVNDPLQIGVYEHEGKEWLIKEKLPDSMQLDAHHTYHISANLDKDQLVIIVSVDNDKTNTWTKAIGVTALDNQRAYGIIASGVAIQWNQQTPKPAISVNTQARPPYFNKTTEVEREKKSKQLRIKALNPTFGSMKLKALSQQAILFGQYLYTTEDTDIKKSSPKNSIDYIVWAINRNQVISDIGIPPISSSDDQSDAPNVIVSVITGNAYDTTGKVVAHAGNLWNTYQKQFGPFDKTITDYITQVQKDIFESLAKISFGSFDLAIINQKALTNGQFMYACAQTILAKDAQGKTIPDYLICAEISNNELGSSIGMPPNSSNAQGLVSLVTGNLYSKTTKIEKGIAPTPISQGYFELNAYTNQFGNLDSTLISNITDAQSAYREYLKAQKEEQEKKDASKVTIFPATKTTDKDVADKNKVSLGGGPGINIHLGTPSKGSIADLQKQAAGPSGFQIHLGAPPKPKN